MALGPTQKRVLEALKTYRDSGGTEGKSAIAISTEVGTSYAAVKDALRRLHKSNLVTATKHGSTRYWYLPPVA